MLDIGTRIEVYWSTVGWAGGVVAEHDALDRRHMLHCIRYDDGTNCFHELDRRKSNGARDPDWRLVRGTRHTLPALTTPQTAAASATSGRGAASLPVGGRTSRLPVGTRIEVFYEERPKRARRSSSAIATASSSISAASPAEERGRWWAGVVTELPVVGLGESIHKYRVLYGDGTVSRRFSLLSALLSSSALLSAVLSAP